VCIKFITQKARNKGVHISMKEGENVRILVDGEEAFGKVIKVYTQIGYENHGKEIAVITLYDSYLKFYESEIEIMNNDEDAGHQIRRY
jgi:hypothetical protein